MTIVLFELQSGLKLSEFPTETEAREELRTANGLAGWRRIGTSWIDGIEREWAETQGGLQDYAPFGITELERWEERFRPEFIKQRKNDYGTQDEAA